MFEQNVTRDSYIFMEVEWLSGFKHIVPCRGYNLKSQINFTKSLQYVKDFSYRLVSAKDYEDRVWGTDEKENSDGPRPRKAKALKEAAPKRKPRQKASKDSKGISKPRRTNKPAAKRASSNGKEARDELREPKVRNVRKPKEDVARTNSPRKATTSRNGTRKSKTQ